MIEVGNSLPSVLQLEEIMEAGYDAIRHGAWKDAIDHFQKATVLKPQYIEPWLRKALAHRNLGDLRAAADSYHKSIEIDATCKEAWTGLIETLHGMGKYKQEVEACDCYLRFRPRSEEALLNKGVALHLLGKLEAALECFTEVIERRPDNVAALNNKGAVLLKLEKFEEALEAFDSAIALEPQQEDVQKNRCLLLLRLGRYSEAVRAAEQMLAVEEEGWLWMLKGLAHAELKEMPLALESFEKAKELDTALEGLEEAIGRTRRLREALDKARERMAVGAEREFPVEPKPLPNAPAVSSQGIAVILTRLGYPTESLRVWQQCLVKDSPDDWLGLGKALVAGGERQSGERCLLEAERLTRQIAGNLETAGTNLPSVWRRIYNRAFVGELDEAVELLSNVLEHDDNLEHGWQWLGILRALGDQLAESRSALRRSIEINANDATAWNNLGAVLTGLNDLVEASAALKRAVALDPQHLEALHNLGFVEWRLGHWEDARKALRKALRIEERAQTWLVLASVMENMNRWRDALHCYERTLSFEPKNTMAMAGMAKARGRLGSIRKSAIDKGSRKLIGLPGIGPNRARALAKAGYTTPNAILRAPLEDLARLPGLTRTTAVELRKALRHTRMKPRPGKSLGK